jgi:hypothetical protein
MQHRSSPRHRTRRVLKTGTNGRTCAAAARGFCLAWNAARPPRRSAVEPGTRLAIVREGVDSTCVCEASPPKSTPVKGLFVKTTGGAMDPKNKFAAETVRQLQQSLDEVAPYEATEFSKQQTIRTLSPQILALRSKGYSWTAVAAMLSGRGVPVSVAALRTYLRRVREEAASEAPRTPTKRSRDSRAGPRQPEPSAPIAALPSRSGETSPATRSPPPGAAPASAVAPQHATVAAPRREQELRRSTFAVRPDRDDI